MVKFWPLHHYNQCMGEIGEKHLAQLVGGGHVNLILSPDIADGMN